MRASLKFFLEKYKINYLRVKKQLCTQDRAAAMVASSNERSLMGECIPFFILLPYLSAPLPICNSQVIPTLDKRFIIEHNKLHRRQKNLTKAKGVFVMEQKNKFKTTVLAVLVAVALVASGYGIAKALKPCEIGTTLPPCATAAAPTPAVSKTAMVPANFSDLAEKVRPGVVNIQVVKKVKNIGLKPA